jgi:tRNA U34 5-methylaminomethyl-2-thiouridine-forming methyltransferase MnmC
MSPLNLVQTGDGTWTSYNPVIGEHYHNLAGALTEAQNIYIAPSRMAERLKTQDHLTVLDPFLGLGYNTFACLDQFRRLKQSQFMDARLTLIAFESDPEILAFIPRILDQPEQNDLKIFSGCFEHKIYYRTQTDLSDLWQSGTLNPDLGIDVKVIVGDTRQLIQGMPSEAFDLVFHDAFSPRKQPELWTRQLAQQYQRVLKPPSGTLLTYSSAAPMRKAFLELGLNLAIIDVPDGKKGTLASLGENPGAPLLSELEFALMDCRSGIPYEDNDTMTRSAEELLAAHQLQKDQSDLPTSSTVHRAHGYFKK